MSKKIFSALCLVLCMAAIFIFSSQNADISGNLSGGITETIAKIFIKDFKTFTLEHQTKIVETMHFYIRKAAHFTIYAALGFFSFTNVSLYTEKTRKKFLISLPFCLLYAASDEIHQLFTDGRCGSPRDVLIDFCGALTGTLAAFLFFKIISYFSKKRSQN